MLASYVSLVLTLSLIQQVGTFLEWEQLVVSGMVSSVM